MLGAGTQYTEYLLAQLYKVLMHLFLPFIIYRRSLEVCFALSFYLFLICLHLHEYAVN